MLAPRSSASTPTSSSVGIIGASAGRSIPCIRPTTSNPVVISAPVLPDEIIASASPSRTIRPATTMDESFLRRTALTGSSSEPITSPACRTLRLDGLSFSSGSSLASSPTSTICVSFHSAAADNAPSTLHSGALSPPMASMAISTTVTPFTILFISGTIHYKVALKYQFFSDIGEYVHLCFAASACK
ncbi:hypothetical protein D3C75_604240 [compost metagenome]